MTVTGPTGATGVGAGAGADHVIYLVRAAAVTTIRSSITGITTALSGPTFTITIPAGTFSPSAAILWSREELNAGYGTDFTYTLGTADGSGGAALVYAGNAAFTTVIFIREVGAATTSG